jgi:hypothetical protein
VHPDLPEELQPPRLVGLDGNTLGFLFALPLALFAGWKAERHVEKDQPVIG